MRAIFAYFSVLRTLKRCRVQKDWVLGYLKTFTENKVFIVVVLVLYLFLIPFLPYISIILFLIVRKNCVVNIFTDSDNSYPSTKPRLIDIFTISSATLLFYIGIILFYYADWNHIVQYCNVTIVGSWELLALESIPFFYFFQNRDYLVAFRKNRVSPFETIILVIGILSPLLINSAIHYSAEVHRLFAIDQLLNELSYALISAASIEEVFFRFFLYGYLRRITKRVFFSQIVSSLLFAFWHIGLVSSIAVYQRLEDIVNMLLIFVVGMISAVIYENTRSIWLCILFHAVNNSFLYYLLHLLKSTSHFLANT